MSAAEQMLAALVQSMTNVQTAIALMAEQKKGNGNAFRTLDLKYKQIPQFTGGTGGQYEDWAFAFKRVIRAENAKAYQMLVMVEGGIDMTEIEYDHEFAGLDVKKYSAEIYDILCQAVSGDPLQAVRSVDDMEGLKAWGKLAAKYSPRSMARAVRLVGQVTNPTKITDLNKAEAELDKWEDLIKILTRDFKEKFSDTVKVGIVATMMPVSVQELIYQSVGKTANYEEVIQKVRAVISNKVAMMVGNGPAPMDIGEVKRNIDCWDWDGQEDEQDGEVGAVSANTQCHNCKGWGHLRSQCPTASASKGSKGKGKGKGKGFNQDWGKGGAYTQNTAKGKGFSKGSFKGACFNCGKTGHRASECQTRHANAVTDETTVEEEYEEAQLGGVWAVGAVDVSEAEPSPPGLLGWNRIQRGRATSCRTTQPQKSKFCCDVKPKCKCPEGHTSCQNLFQVLADFDDDETMMKDIMGVDPALPLTRTSAIEFNVADVRKPLASAVKMVRKGNRVVLDEDGSYIQNKNTGECMEVKIKDETFVFEVQFENGEQGVITLDSGAGVHVWPKDKLKGVPTMPKSPGLRMCAANGSEIKNHGRKLIKFRGNDFSKSLAEQRVFTRQA